MRKIVSTTVTGERREYIVPNRVEALAHSERTKGSQWDRIERRVIEGGIPMIWDRVQ